MNLDHALGQDDIASVKAGSKSVVQITLEEEPRIRVVANGDTFVSFYGAEDGAERPLMGVFKVPDALAPEGNISPEMDEALRNLGGGDRLSLAGQWVENNWKRPDGTLMTATSFRTQMFVDGNASLEQMMDRLEGRDAAPQPARGPNLAMMAARMAEQSR